MSMITAATWIPRGYAAQFPTKYDIDDVELARISKLAQLKLEDANHELQSARSESNVRNGVEHSEGDEDGESDDQSGVKLPRSKEEADNDLREYDLDHYDSDDEAGAAGEGDNMTMAMFGNPNSLAYHESNVEDPYITLPENEDDDEREELQVLPSDNMVIAAKVEDEVAHLEIYVYEGGEDNLYVHHDIMLPAIPLCVEWLDIAVGTSASGKPVDQGIRANFVAVGTLDPDIEIWNLDTVDCMYPNAILGAGGLEDARSDSLDQPTKKSKRRKKSQKPNDSYHVDAVLSLAANRNHRTLLASASADKTVKLWDLSTATCARSYNHHTDKVCSIAWHAQETTVLLSGSYDRTIVAADMRAPDVKAPRWGVESDIEIVRWDPHNPNHFFATTEAGMVHYHDIRAAPSTPEKSSPIWKLQAHDGAVSSFDVNPTVPGFLATGSSDKQVKLWNIQASGPSMVVSRNLEVGRVFATTFAPDPEVGFHLAIAGSKGTVQIWDTSTNAAVRGIFANRMAPGKDDLTERLIRLEEDSSDSDEGDGDEDQEDQEDQEDESNGKGWESMEEV